MTGIISVPEKTANFRWNSTASLRRNNSKVVRWIRLHYTLCGWDFPSLQLYMDQETGKTLLNFRRLCATVGAASQISFCLLKTFIRFIQINTWINSSKRHYLISATVQGGLVDHFIKKGILCWYTEICLLMELFM